MNSERRSIKVEQAAAYAPATVSNVGCGFDVLGFALEQPGDVVIAIPREQPGVAILDISGDDGRLPREAERNTASRAVTALLRFVNRSPEELRHNGTEECSPEGLRHKATEDRSPSGLRHNAGGVGLILRKGLPRASGIGSSGASAVAAVLAANHALGLDASPMTLLRAAMEGERASAGAIHPDNVAPALLGGFVLARSVDPPDVVRLPVPADLACAVLHPFIEVETRAARAVLPELVPLRDAVRQWANVGALVAALHSGDLDLLGRAMIDHIVEPHRAHLVPGFSRITQAAMAQGAIGCTLSGAGPSMFALCRGLENAREVGEAMRRALGEHGGLEGQVFVSPVSPSGARIVDGVD